MVVCTTYDANMGGEGAGHGAPQAALVVASDQRKAATERTSAVPAQQQQVSQAASVRASAKAPVVSKAEERMRRRRMQYKVHQQRHRARQKVKHEQLADSVRALTAEVSALTERCALLQSQRVFSARGMLAGAPVRTIMEYFRVFEQGYSRRSWLQQEQFLRATMVDNLQGPECENLDSLLMQWKLYGSMFSTLLIRKNSTEVSTLGGMTHVVVDLTIQLRPHRRGLTSMYPGITDDEVLIQSLVDTVLVIPSTQSFLFAPDGRVTWYAVQMDLLTCLHRALGSLERVAMVVDGARVSFSTGRIEPSGEGTRRQRHGLTSQAAAPAPPPITGVAASTADASAVPPTRAAPTDPRHALQFLLS